MRVYNVSADGMTIAATDGDTDVAEFTAGDDKPIALCGIGIYITSELQEAQEEWLRFQIIRGHSTSGSTPDATPTPRPVNHNDPAAAFTAELSNATIASAGTAVTVGTFAMNVRAGYELIVPQGFEWTTDQTAGLLVVRLTTAVADDLTYSAQYWVGELA